MTGDPGSDYAALSRGGDRWDFEQASDVASISNVSVTAGVCGGGGCGIVPSDRPGATPGSKMLRASSAGATPSQLGDPALEFLNGAIPPLSGTRHEYVTFSLRLHRPYDIGTGSVTRILWGSQSFADASVMTQTQDMRVWPGFNQYTIDLASLAAANGGIEHECPTCPTTPWPSRSIRFFRIDPHEFGDTATGFDIDDVSLTAPNTKKWPWASSSPCATASPIRHCRQHLRVAHLYRDLSAASGPRAAAHRVWRKPERRMPVPGSTQSRRPCRRAATSSTPRSSKPTAVQQVSGAYATGPIVITPRPEPALAS